MTLPTEELLQQYFDDRLALARSNFIQNMGQFMDPNLTLHELRVVLLVASGVASSPQRLGELLQVSEDSLDATLSQLIQHGCLDTHGVTGGHVSPTDEAMDILDAFAERKDATMALLADLDPEDLTALVRGTHMLRVATEEQLALQHRETPSAHS